jgi:hypothetical protein
MIMKRSWDFGNFEITSREIIASVTIVAVMLMIGFVIAGKLEAHQMDKNAEYNKAVHITDSAIFQYGMDTDLGNAFVYGKLQAVDPVNFTELGGDYLYVEKVEEHYVKHTRTVAKTRTKSNGETEEYEEEEEYSTWDYYNSWEKYSQKIRFCGIEFDYGKIKRPGSRYIKTEQSFLTDIRFVYSGCKAEYTGTIYTDLRDNTMSSGSHFYQDQDIDETVDQLTSRFGTVMFWIFWIVLTGGVVFGFYYMDNKWLE